MIIDLYDTTMYIKQLQLFVTHLMGKKNVSAIGSASTIR